MTITSIRPKVSTVSLSKGSAGMVERIRGYALTKIRDRILLRDCYTCQECGRVSLRLEVDHIVPLHLGGTESDENRQSLCRECHLAKSEREANERGRGG